MYNFYNINTPQNDLQISKKPLILDTEFDTITDSIEDLLQRTFSKTDTNSNHEITEEELTKLVLTDINKNLSKLGKSPIPEDKALLFSQNIINKADTDGSRTLNLDEFKKYFYRFFKESEEIYKNNSNNNRSKFAKAVNWTETLTDTSKTDTSNSRDDSFAPMEGVEGAEKSYNMGGGQSNNNNNNVFYDSHESEELTDIPTFIEGNTYSFEKQNPLETHCFYHNI